MNLSRFIAALLIALAIAAGAMLWLQRQAAAEMRAEIAQLREEHGELARLRAENRRLAAAQLSAAELERMRADHAAVMRLRSEIETLKDNVKKQEAALATQRLRKDSEAAAASPGASPER